jgi:hypothetical protein
MTYVIVLWCVCCCAERLHVDHGGPVCFYEVLAPYYFQVGQQQQQQCLQHRSSEAVSYQQHKELAKTGPAVVTASDREPDNALGHQPRRVSGCRPPACTTVLEPTSTVIKTVYLFYFIQQPIISQHQQLSKGYMHWCTWRYLRHTHLQ